MVDACGKQNDGRLGPRAHAHTRCYHLSNIEHQFWATCRKIACCDGVRCSNSGAVRTSIEHLLPSVAMMGCCGRMAASLSLQLFQFLRNFDHTTTEACNVLLVSILWCGRCMKHRPHIDHTISKTYCENSDLSVKITIATQKSARNKTDRQSFDNVQQDYCLMYGKGIV